MARTRWTLVCTFVFMTILCRHATAKQPATQPTTAPKRIEFSDAAVKRSINRGREFFWSKQQADGSWPAKGKKGAKDYYRTGPSAMAIYALLESWVNPQDPRMLKALKWLEKTPEQKTFCLAMRCCAWEAAGRTTDDKYGKILKSDLRRIMESSADGSFSYDVKGKPKSNGDNFNSQFGIMAMQAGSLGNLGIRSITWKKCMDHWMRTQSKQGGWTHKGLDNNPTMTPGGVASMYACIDHLYTQRFVKEPRTAKDIPALMTIAKGLGRIDANFKSFEQANARFDPDYMYAIARVALASGYKRFNGVDWWKSGATYLLNKQKPDGSWGEIHSTSLAMLFLIRGQHPTPFNKLKYDGDWNNRPRDLATLTRWMSRTYSKQFSWNAVDIRSPISDWRDAPILLITGSKEHAFSKTEIGKLRKFVLQGGTILSVTEFGGKEFSQSIRKTYKQMFSTRKLELMPKWHEIYTQKVYYKLPQEDMKFEMVSNGVRPLIIHTDTDLTGHWQSGLHMTAKASPAFRAATNIARYVCGQLYNLRHRGVSSWPEKRDIKTTRTIKIARIQHAGNWNPEPLAFEALAMRMKNRTKIDLQEIPPLAIVQLPKSGVKFAMMTGTGTVKFKDAEKKAIKAFVEGGGTILIDIAGGDSKTFKRTRPFTYSVRDALKEIYPGRRSRPRQLAFNSPLYKMPGYNIKDVRFRHHTRFMLVGRFPQVRSVSVNGRPAILFSELDLTAGLVGYPSLAVDGYAPDSAFELVRNMIIYANG